jgi:hypothetical protein
MWSGTGASSPLAGRAWGTRPMAGPFWYVVSITKIVAPPVAWKITVPEGAWPPRGWGDGACPIVGTFVRSSRLAFRPAPISLLFVAAVHDHISSMLVWTPLVMWAGSRREWRLAVVCRT